jgi:hypothetical protein
MITEKGILPVGIEKDGKVHREFEVRPALVKDSIEVGDEHAHSALKNQFFVGVCLTAKQIVRIGDISPVPVELLVEMYDLDLGAITAAKDRLAKRLIRFRSEQGPQGTTEELSGSAENAAQNSAGDAEASVPAGGDSEHAAA